MSSLDFEQALRSIEQIDLARVAGRLVRVNGILLECVGCRLAIGQLCHVESIEHEMMEAQVVGFDREVTYLMPFKQPSGLIAGARVFPAGKSEGVMIGDQWLGRVVNGLGEPLDDKGKLGGDTLLPQQLPQVHPLKRQPVEAPLDVGVRAINGLLTIGKGQRVGLMAGSGVGKSVLLGMITRYTQAEVVVVGLIGERGREVKEFIENSLQAEGLAKSVIVAAPADESPLMRIKATELCHTIASYYRDKGKDVLLLVDSLTRYAMAQREIALSLGEPPATKGYPPSAFSMIPRLVESAAGIDKERGDALTLDVLAFTAPATDSMLNQKWWKDPDMQYWGQNGGIGLLALLTLLFGVRPLAQRLGRRERLVNEAQQNERGLLTDESEAQDDNLTALPSTAFNNNDDLLPPQSSGLETKVEYLQVLAQSETERVAEVLKQWINSNDRSNSKSE